MNRLKKILKIIDKFKLELITIIFFSLTLILNFYILNTYFQDKLQEQKNLILKKLKSIKTNLEKEIYSRIYCTQEIAVFVSLNPDINQTEFIKLAKELISTCLLYTSPSPRDS